jgi:type IV pilus assembly protein PilQ
MTRWLQTVVLIVSGAMFFLPQSSAQDADSTPSVTLNLIDMDIQQFLRFAHDISGVNIVVAPDVRSRVTAFIHDVQWEQALDAVLKTNGFIGRREGNTLRVMTYEGATREEEQRRQLERAEQSAAPLEVCTYSLLHADAGDMAGILRGFLSPRGRIVADTRTNSLIVGDVPQVLKRLGISPVPPSRGRCVTGGQSAQ